MPTDSKQSHTMEPWSHTEWKTTGPSAAAAYILSKSVQEHGHFYCQIAQADLDPGLSVCVAVGNDQDSANANAARIVAAVNSVSGIPDPAHAIKMARDALKTACAYYASRNYGPAEDPCWAPQIAAINALAALSPADSERGEG